MTCKGRGVGAGASAVGPAAAIAGTVPSRGTAAGATSSNDIGWTVWTACGGRGSSVGAGVMGRDGAMVGAASLGGKVAAGRATCGTIRAGASLGVMRKYCSVPVSAGEEYFFDFDGGPSGSVLTTRYS